MQLANRVLISITAASMALFSLNACNASRTAKGGAIGAAAGGAAGAAIGNQFNNSSVVGALIGAAVGGTAGALIGREMDKQAQELESDLEGADVERVGEGIKITFDSGLMFALNEASLNEQTQSNLRQLAETLRKYEDTDILIEGHTDSSGSDTYNQDLSERRSQSVADFLAAEGVARKRMSTVGYGETQPIASNETPEGMQTNRRVEVAIYANDKMVKAAERGDLGTVNE